MSDLGLADYPARALHLLAYSLAPAWLSPDPQPASAARGVLALVALAALVAATLWFGRRLKSRLASAAVVLALGAVAVALLWVAGLGGDETPLGRGAVYVGPLWWASLALASAAAAHRLLVEAARRQAAAVVGCLVVILGAFQLWRAKDLMASPEAMWRRALDIEPAHLGALTRVSMTLVEQGAYEDVAQLAGRCVAKARARCGCHGLRSFALLRGDRRGEALAVAEAALAICGDDALLRASYAHALALAGRHEEALAEAEQVAASPEASRPLVELELRHARALAYQQLGQAARAIAEAQAAVEAGGGRDAQLLAAAIAIATGKLDLGARSVDAILRAHPGDPDGLYNRALIADLRGDFNAAREGYLATLRAAPRYAAARYNLAVLTWRRGVEPEARHHAKLFVRDYPGDPRGPTLQAMMKGPADEPAPAWLPSPAGGPDEGKAADQPATGQPSPPEDREEATP